MAVIDEQLLTIEKAAESLGLSTKRLLAWMVDNDWLVMGDMSYDVIQSQVSVDGNLAVKNGVRITSKGMQSLRIALNPTIEYAASRKASDPIDHEEVPF